MLSYSKEEEHRCSQIKAKPKSNSVRSWVSEVSQIHSWSGLHSAWADPLSRSPFAAHTAYLVGWGHCAPHLLLWLSWVPYYNGGSTLTRSLLGFDPTSGCQAFSAFCGPFMTSEPVPHGRLLHITKFSFHFEPFWFPASVCWPCGNICRWFCLGDAGLLLIIAALAPANQRH